MSGITTEQAFDCALRHHRAGRLPEAEQHYRLVLAQHPQHPESIHYLGVIAHQMGQREISLELINRAISFRFNYPEAHNNLSNVLRSAGQIDQAIAAARQAITQNPNYADAHNNLGTALIATEDFDQAIAEFHRAIALQPDHAQAHNNLGNALIEVRQPGPAIAALRRAIEINPLYADAHYNLSNAFKCTGQLDEAIAAVRQAIALNRNNAQAHNNLGNALAEIGQPKDAIAAFRQAITIGPDYIDAHSNLILILHYDPDSSPQAIAKELRKWNQQYAQPLRKSIEPHANDRNPDRPLRLGYVSPDFRNHVVGRSILPLFQHHDRRQFEITCYSHVSRPDAMTAKLRENVDRWRHIIGRPDDEVAEKIRADQIDILIDLTLHSANNRLLIFARKPAPVQICYLGHCGSTGLSTMDYRLSDPHLDPPDSDLSNLSEKTIRLPRTYWCYQPSADPTPEPSPPPVLQNGFITFGSLNNFAKVSLPALDLWTRILLAVPDSRLILHSPEGAHRQNIAYRLERFGVGKDRLIFVGRQTWSQYAQTYSQIDIGLDTFPHSSAMTTSDALWMGVPVVPLSTQSAVGRAAGSVLTNAGSPELIANTPDQYVQIAANLAKDVSALASHRLALRGKMQQSPLMDAPNFARDVETAYRRMWHANCDA